MSHYDGFVESAADRKIRDLEQALAEKDREIEQLKHSLFEVAEKLGPYKEKYEAGVAAWQPVYEELQHKMSKKDQAYHALMAQAVRFANLVLGHSGGSEVIHEVQKFLASPEVREWREQEDQP